MIPNILLAFLVGAAFGIAFVLVKIYAELQYANDLKSSELKAKCIELPER